MAGVRLLATRVGRAGSVAIVMLEILHVERPVVKWAEENGWFTLKINVIGKRGFPDHLFFAAPRVLVLMEFKRPGSKLDQLQKWVHGKLDTLGWTVYTVQEVNDGISILREEQERAVAAEALSRTGHRHDDGTGVGGTISGPRPRED